MWMGWNMWNTGVVLLKLHSSSFAPPEGKRALNKVDRDSSGQSVTYKSVAAYMVAVTVAYLHIH